MVIVVVVLFVVFEKLLILVLLEFPDPLLRGEGRNHHADVSACPTWFHVHGAHRFEVYFDFLEELKSKFRVCLLASPEHQLDPQLVPVIEKFFRSSQFDAIVVRVDVDPEFDLLNLGRLAFLALLLLRLLVLPLPVVNDLTDWGLR